MAGGGYTFDADAVEARIRQLESISDRIRDHQQQLDRGSWVDPPSLDQPGREQAKAAALSIEQAAAHSGAMSDYLTAYLQKLREAAGRYDAREDESTGALFGK